MCLGNYNTAELLVDWSWLTTDQLYKLEYITNKISK
jgi:hypothetical protein